MNVPMTLNICPCICQHTPIGFLLEQLSLEGAAQLSDVCTCLVALMTKPSCFCHKAFLETFSGREGGVMHNHWDSEY